MTNLLDPGRWDWKAAPWASWPWPTCWLELLSCKAVPMNGGFNTKRTEEHGGKLGISWNRTMMGCEWNLNGRIIGEQWGDCRSSNVAMGNPRSKWRFSSLENHRALFWFTLGKPSGGFGSDFSDFFSSKLTEFVDTTGLNTKEIIRMWHQRWFLWQIQGWSSGVLGFKK